MRQELHIFCVLLLASFTCSTILYASVLAYILNGKYIFEKSFKTRFFAFARISLPQSFYSSVVRPPTDLDVLYDQLLPAGACRLIVTT